MNKTILRVALSLVLVTLICTCAYATDDGSGQDEEMYYTFNPADYSNYFLMLDQNIDYQNSNFTYAIPMKAGDSLYVNLSLDANASYQCLDPVGFDLLLNGDGSEENWNQVLNHTIWDFTVVNSSSYEAFATAQEDTWFCLVVWPADDTQLPAGNITAVRCSQYEEDIGPGLNGFEFLDYCYASLPENESYDDEMPWVPDMSVDDAYYPDDGLSWGPDIPSYSSYPSSTEDEDNLGPITGPDLSSTSINDQDIPLGLATYTPITGPTGDYVVYNSVSSDYMDAEAEAAYNSWYDAYERSLMDDLSYGDMVTN